MMLDEKPLNKPNVTTHIIGKECLLVVNNIDFLNSHWGITELISLGSLMCMYTATKSVKQEFKFFIYK